MKKLLLLILSIGLSQLSYADYLDDWPDDALCGWMENPSPPSYMVEEVITRGISCSGGVAINNLPDSLDNNLPSPGEDVIYHRVTNVEWLKAYNLTPFDIEPLLKATGLLASGIIGTKDPDIDPEGNIVNLRQLIDLLIERDPNFNYIYDPEMPPECLEGSSENAICTIDEGEIPPLPDPPIVQPIPIRPGWKILEGTDMLVIDDTDPYWQTEEGLIERPPKIDPGIEYAPETVLGADPKIVPDLPPEVDKPPSDPNPPPKLDDPSVLQPVDPSIQGVPDLSTNPNPSDPNSSVYSVPNIEYAHETATGADAPIASYSSNPTSPVADSTDPNPPPKIAETHDYPAEDPNPPPRIPAPPVVDKPPSDPNPPPKLDDPSVLQPVDPG